MKIAIVSDFNIAGQCTALMRAINKYTPHKARCIIANDDFLSYDRDIILNSKDTCTEAAEWCRNADFFHFGRGIFKWPGIDWYKDGKPILNRNNCCIKYYGSELRNNPKQIIEFHQKTGIAAITGTDWSIAGLLPGAFYHLGSYFTKFGDMDLADIEHCTFDINGSVRICCGSAGSPLKGYDFLKQTISELQREGYPIELDIIAGLPNNECLKRKWNSWVTFTSLHGAWGISGIESMWLGHAVLSCLDSWILSMYPESPTILINKQNLKEKLICLCKMDFSERIRLSEATRKFAYDNFRTSLIIKRYVYLFDLIMHRDEYLKGFVLPKIIY